MRMTGPFDRLPREWQDLVLLLVPVLCGWAASDVVPWLAGRGGPAGLIAAWLAQLLLFFSPATRAYGIGSGPGPGRHSIIGVQGNKENRTP